jgi:hypothetical protein
MVPQFNGGLAAQLRKRRQQPGGMVVNSPLGNISVGAARPPTLPAPAAPPPSFPVNAPPPIAGGALPLPQQQGAGIGFGGQLASALAARPMGMAGGSGLPVPAQPAGMALNTPAAPITQPAPTGMGYQGRTPPRLNPRQIGNRSANQAFRRQQEMWGEYLKPALERLREQAGQDRFSDTERAHYLAPHLDALRQQMQGAEGALTRGLQERGLGGSSGMASGLGALLGAGAQARTGVISDLFNREEDRQQRAQEMELQISQALATGQQGLAASLANQLRQLELQEEALRNSQEGGGFLGDLLGGVGGLLGSAGGLGGLSSLFGGGRGRGGVRNALTTGYREDLR